MLIQEIVNIFNAKYSLECQLKKIQQVIIADKVLSFFLSAAQQDIQRRLSVVESSTSITLGTTTNLYALPQTFGKQKHAYIGNTILEERPIDWAEKQSAMNASGDWYAIKITGHTPYLYCPVSSGTLTIVYYPDLNYYQPSVSASQTWGTFDGVVYSGNLLLPDRYNMAILYWMWAQIFPEYFMFYEKELKSLRESRQFSVEETLRYNLGGLDDNEGEGLSASTIGGAVDGDSHSPGVSVGGLDQPLKKIRLIAADTGTYSVKFNYGWEVTPTIINNITSIIISSANSEFINYIHTQTNQDFGWTQTGATTITIVPDPTTAWGEVEIIIDIYA